MAEKTKKKIRNKKLVLNIIIISVAACTAIAVLLTIFASSELSSTYEQLVEETLKTAAIQMADEIERMYEGEWNLDEDDVLWKGETAFRGQFTGSLKQRTGLDYAIFYDNIRAITTVEGSPVGRKNADTTAPSDIYNTVVKNGQTYYRPNYIVAGQQYSGVYAPVLADDGSIGGMTCAFRKTADVNAAIGLAQIRQYGHLLEERKRIYNLYDEAFSKEPWAILPPSNKDGFETSYHVYALRIRGISESQRDAIINEIARHEVAVNVHFVPLPMLTYYRQLGYKIEDYPQAYCNYAHEISLPVYPQLDDEKVRFVIKTVIDAYNTVTNTK